MCEVPRAGNYSKKKLDQRNLTSSYKDCSLSRRSCQAFRYPYYQCSGHFFVMIYELVVSLVLMLNLTPRGFFGGYITVGCISDREIRRISYYHARGDQRYYHDQDRTTGRITCHVTFRFAVKVFVA